MFSFVTSVKDRLTSPLYSSFIISWIPWNWKIVVGLTYYRSEHISDIKDKVGNTLIPRYNDLMDLIIKEGNCLNSLLYPLIFAIGYTLLNPYIKRLINLGELLISSFHSNNEKNLKGKIYISPEEYLKLTDDIKAEKLKFADSVNNYKNKVNECIQLQNKLNEYNHSFSKLQNDYNKLGVTISNFRTRISNVNSYLDENRNINLENVIRMFAQVTSSYENLIVDHLKIREKK